MGRGGRGVEKPSPGWVRRVADGARRARVREAEDRGWGEAHAGRGGPGMGREVEKPSPGWVRMVEDGARRARGREALAGLGEEGARMGRGWGEEGEEGEGGEEGEEG